MPNLLNGRWDAIRIVNNPDNAVLNSQQTAVHACLAYNPNDDTWKVLYFRAADLEDNVIKTRLWHPPSEADQVQISSQTIPDWPPPVPPPDPPLPKPRLFCGGHAFMHDGKLLAVGGNLGPVAEPFKGLNYAYTFDPTIAVDNLKWKYLGSPFDPIPMQAGRWYPTVTLLRDRRLLVMSGWIIGPNPPPNPPTYNRLPEIWNVDANSWIRRTAPEAQMPFDALYPGAHVVPRGQYEGKVFYSEPMLQSYIFDPDFTGSGNYYWKKVPNAEREPLRDGGCSLLLPIKPSPNAEAKVMILGGAHFDQQFNTNVATNTTQMIDLGAATPVWQTKSSMAMERTHANAVILPDGKILVFGGNQASFSEGAVTNAEVYDPDTDVFTLLPPCSYTRMYHSTAILLPDATVWVGGGDALAGSPSSNFIEIYSPGYLFDGPPPPPPGNYLSVRPTILSMSAAQITYDDKFNITTDLPVDMAILISLGATTHAFDQNQRAVILTPTLIGPINSVYHYEVTTPQNSNIAPPGYYMLFVLRPKSASNSGNNRIPSIAKFLRLLL